MIGYGGGVDNPVVDLSVPHRYKPGQVLLRWEDAGRIAEAHLCTDGHVMVMTDSGIGNCKCGRTPPKRESPSGGGTDPFVDQPWYRQSFKIIKEGGGASHLCQFHLPDTFCISRIWEPYGTACPKCGLTVFDDGSILLAGRMLDANDVRDLFLEAVSGASVEIKQEIKTPDADSFRSHSPQVGDVVDLKDIVPVPGTIGRYKFRKAQAGADGLCYPFPIAKRCPCEYSTLRIGGAPCSNCGYEYRMTNMGKPILFDARGFARPVGPAAEDPSKVVFDKTSIEHAQVQIRCPVCGDETDHCPNGMRCRGKPAG